MGLRVALAEPGQQHRGARIGGLALRCLGEVVDDEHVSLTIDLAPAIVLRNRGTGSALRFYDAMLAALREPQVWLTLGIGAIGFGGLFAVTVTRASGASDSTEPPPR